MRNYYVLNSNIHSYVFSQNYVQVVKFRTTGPDLLFIDFIKTWYAIDLTYFIDVNTCVLFNNSCLNIFSESFGIFIDLTMVTFAVEQKIKELLEDLDSDLVI